MKHKTTKQYSRLNSNRPGTTIGPTPVGKAFACTVGIASAMTAAFTKTSTLKRLPKN